MAVLTHPLHGTVVQVTGEAERAFRARGWTEASAPAPDESKPAPRRSRKND